MTAADYSHLQKSRGHHESVIPPALLIYRQFDENNINAQFVIEYSVMPSDRCYLV